MTRIKVMLMLGFLTMVLMLLAPHPGLAMHRLSQDEAVRVKGSTPVWDASCSWTLCTDKPSRTCVLDEHRNKFIRQVQQDIPACVGPSSGVVCSKNFAPQGFCVEIQIFSDVDVKCEQMETMGQDGWGYASSCTQQPYA